MWYPSSLKLLSIEPWEQPKWQDTGKRRWAWVNDLASCIYCCIYLGCASVKENEYAFGRSKRSESVNASRLAKQVVFTHSLWLSWHIVLTQLPGKKRFAKFCFFLSCVEKLHWSGPLRRQRRSVIYTNVYMSLSCTSLKSHMTLSPSQTGLLRISGCWSHFSAPPPGHWLYCGERPTYAWF